MSLLELLVLIFVKNPKRNRKTNPYKLYWYKSGWSKTKTAKNNEKYWRWEIENNGFKH